MKVIAKRIGVPLDKWAGRCHEIALLIHKAKLVPSGSRVVYGLWLGKIEEGNMFSGRPFTHHGWIELPDGMVYDPTRFAFENKQPYVWVGHNGGEYDPGGNTIRRQNETPRPKPKGLVVKLTKAQATAIKEFVPITADRKIHLSDCFWLANLSLHSLGQDAADIYKVLVDLGFSGLIPIDNRHVVLGK